MRRARVPLVSCFFPHTKKLSSLSFAIGKKQLSFTSSEGLPEGQQKEKWKDEINDYDRAGEAARGTVFKREHP